MSQAAPTTPGRKIQLPELTRPLAIWLGVQLFALLLACGQVQLAARFPTNTASVAVEEMICVQIIASAMLFPLLLSSWRTTAACIAAAWPFVFLAGVLAERYIDRVAMASAYVSGWLLLLAIWNRLLKSPSAKMFLVAITSVIALGGPLLWYLWAEFHHGGFVSPGRLTAFTPILAAISLVRKSQPDLMLWIPLVLALGVSAALRVRTHDS